MKHTISLALVFFLFLGLQSKQLSASVSKNSDSNMVSLFDQDPKHPEVKKEKTTTKKASKKSKTAEKKIVDEKIAVSEESQSQDKKKKSSDPKK